MSNYHDDRSWSNEVSYKPYGMHGRFGNQVSPVNYQPQPQPQHKSKSMGVSPTMEQQDNYLNSKVGMLIKINRGGPESFDGVLVSVQSGYVVMRTKAGLVYVNAGHIKSTTDLPGQKSGRSASNNFIVAGSFVGVLRKLSQQFVQVNWGGPEKIEGFIAEVGNQSLLLVVGQDKVLIPLYHIKTVKHTGQYASNGSRGNSSKGNSSSGNKNSSSGNKNSSSGNKNSSSNKNSSKNKNSSNKGGKSKTSSVTPKAALKNSLRAGKRG